jgi:hypothetical protein
MWIWHAKRKVQMILKLSRRIVCDNTGSWSVADMETCAISSADEQIATHP